LNKCQYIYNKKIKIWDIFTYKSQHIQ